MAFSLTSNMDFLKKLPAYKPFLKTVLKSQIQLLVDQLSEYGEEESVFLTASLSDGTLSHIGSKSGQVFLDSNEDIKAKFLKFCLEGDIDANQNRSACRQQPGPKTLKKVNKKRKNSTNCKMPVSKRYMPHAETILLSSSKNEELNTARAESFTSEVETTVLTCSDVTACDGQLGDSEACAVKYEVKENCLEKVCNESNEIDEGTCDHQTGCNDRSEIFDTKEGLDSAHETAEDSVDVIQEESLILSVDAIQEDSISLSAEDIQEDSVTIKIEPLWEGEREASIPNIEVKSNKNNAVLTPDHSSNYTESLFVCPSASSGKTAAHLLPEFLCVDDDLIWEKNSLPKQKRVIKAASLLTKYSVIKEVEKQKKSKAVIAEEFGIPKSTLSTWLKHSEKIKADVEGEKIDPNKKKRRFSNFYDIEEALLEWLKIVHLQAVIPKITSVNICDKANQLAKQFGYTPETFQCSKAWVERFKTRHGFKKNFVKGDGCSGD